MGEPECLEFGVPWVSDQPGDRCGQRHPEFRGLSNGGAQPVFGDENIPMRADVGTKKTQARRCAEPLTGLAGHRVLGHLVTNRGEGQQRTCQPRSGAGRALPHDLGTQGAGRDGLLIPVDGHLDTEHARKRPLDVGAQCPNRGMDEHHALSIVDVVRRALRFHVRCHRCSLVEFVFPNDSTGVR